MSYHLFISYPHLLSNLLPIIYYIPILYLPYPPITEYEESMPVLFSRKVHFLVVLVFFCHTVQLQLVNGYLVSQTMLQKQKQQYPNTHTNNRYPYPKTKYNNNNVYQSTVNQNQNQFQQLKYRESNVIVKSKSNNVYHEYRKEANRERLTVPLRITEIETGAKVRTRKRTKLRMNGSLEQQQEQDSIEDEDKKQIKEFLWKEWKEENHLRFSENHNFLSTRTKQEIESKRGIKKPFERNIAPISPFISMMSILAISTLAILYNPSIVHATDATGLSVTDFASTSDFLSVMATVLPTNMNSVFNRLGSGGFLQAFSLVFVSEIGDKTFFIAGLLAMKTSRLISFIGSMGALAVMTVISVLIGQIFHAIPNIPLLSGVKVDDIAAVIAFAFFGLKTLKEAYELEDGDSSGIEEERKDAEEAVESSQAIVVKTPWATIFQIFSLVFAAEFGDRSFLSTIALGAAQNPVSVAIGAIAAHATATGIAVLGGAFLSKYLSEKVIGYIGGSLFIVFAFTTALGIF